MTFIPDKAVIVIPSLEPDDRLPAYADKLLERGFCQVVTIDDGSVGEQFQAIFDRMAENDRITVLHHEVNRGKGAALRTGYAWIKENLPDIEGIITADADGQHTVEDCVRLAEELHKGQRALYLGSRDFNLPNVPERSKKGNHITTAVFKALYGVYLPDTQTGLRAFRKEDLQFMLDVDGDRYEYEMKVLIACARAKLPMIPITIETVYENDNAGSHFHPVRDSWRIYKVILGSFFKFAAVSIASWVIDQGLANLLLYVLLPALGITSAGLLENISGYGARLVSSVFNFFMNRKVVFNKQGNLKQHILRYAILCIGIITVSNLAVWLLDTLVGGTGLHWLFKLIIDLLLYVVSYSAQERWVFRED